MEGNETVMRERRNACVILAGKSPMWLPLGRAMHIRKDDTEMALEQGDRIWRDSSGSGWGLQVSVEGRSCRLPLKII